MLAGAADQVEFEADQAIVSKGEPLSGLHILAVGRLSASGRDDLHPGDVFGEASLVGSFRCAATYRACEPSLMFRVPSAAFAGVFRRHPDLERRVRQAAGEPPLEDFAKGFEILRFIAQGGMGTVYLARDKLLGRSVAIKRMRPEVRLDPRGPEMFLKEARIVAALRHPNIVEIFSVVEEAQEVYLIFEFVEGRNLNSIVDEDGPLPPHECLRVVRQVAAALEYAHGRHVLHRDLKPSNIMVSSGGVARVMDFGIARQAKNTISRMSHGEPCGTLAYMSPEQHLGTEKRQGDLYSLAISLYVMLTGAFPFTGPDYLDQKERLEFAPLAPRLKALGVKLDAFLAQALAPAPRDRPADVAAFRRLLEDAMAPD